MRKPHDFCIACFCQGWLLRMMLIFLATSTRWCDPGSLRLRALVRWCQLFGVNGTFWLADRIR